MKLQPIPQKIQQNNPKFGEQKFNTLLIDGSNLLELSYYGCKKLSKYGNEVGGIYQFLLQIKIMLKKANFRYVYVFWDGDNSGQKRYNIYPLYKQNRDKDYYDDNLSDYMKRVNEKVKSMQEHAYGKKRTRTELEKEQLFEQREIIMNCLEELFVRQFIFDEVEADDLISYYVLHKKSNEKIVILSNDRDLIQLISNDVIVYIQSLSKFINTRNCVEILGYDYRNVTIKKVICGDASDNIKGIKGVGEKTLLNNFSELKERKVELNEIIDKAKNINEERLKNKKKPLKWAENIVNSVTDGVQGNMIYVINNSLVDLMNPECPMMTNDAKIGIKEAMYAPIDPLGRSMTNLYNIVYDNGIEDLMDETNFSNFFIEFTYLIEREKRNI